MGIVKVVTTGSTQSLRRSPTSNQMALRVRLLLLMMRNQKSQSYLKSDGTPS